PPTFTLFPYTTLFRSFGSGERDRRIVLRLESGAAWQRGDCDEEKSRRIQYELRAGGHRGGYFQGGFVRVARKGHSGGGRGTLPRSEEHTSELQSQSNL